MLDIIDFAQVVWDGFVYIFYHCFLWVLDGILICIGYPLLYITKGFFAAVYLVFSGVDIGAYAVNFAAELSGLPDALRYLISQCGVTSGITVILASIGIRMLINLIPAAVTRV